MDRQTDSDGRIVRLKYKCKSAARFSFTKFIHLISATTFMNIIHERVRTSEERARTWRRDIVTPRHT